MLGEMSAEFLAIAVAIGSLCVSGIAIITFWMKISHRIDEADAKAEAADKAAASADVRIVSVEKELVEHRVSVAREYVSKETLVSLEKRIVEAINQVGVRLDSLFKAQH